MKAFRTITLLSALALTVGSILAQTYMWTTLAGNGTVGSADGPGSAAEFYRPGGVAVDGRGNVFISDTYNSTIRMIKADGVVSTLAGLAGFFPSADGTGSAARFSFPAGLAVDSAGNLYVADSSNHMIRKIAAGGVVTTFAGQPFTLGGNADGLGSAARFSFPGDVVVDGSGNLYVADTSNNTIRKITPSRAVTTLAGLAGNFGASADGTGSAARFFEPIGVALDANGNLYVADIGSYTIRKVTPAGVVTTVAGKPGSTGNLDGTGSAARFGAPSRFAGDRDGNLYITDSGNHTIRKMTAGGIVSTVAGKAGSAGSTDGPDSAAQFNNPRGIAVDDSGILYVADYNNNTIRKGVPVPAPLVTFPLVTTQPQSVTVATGSTAVFSVKSTTADVTYQWKRNGVAVSGGSGPTLVVANSQAANVGTYTCDVTNAAGITTSATATLAISATSDVGRILNLAIRSNAGIGAQTLLVGLTISGGAVGATKPLLVRGAGPALSAFGVPGALADPLLTFFQGTTVVASNDNWGGDATLAGVIANVGAFAFSPATSKDAALYNATTSAGSHTVQITGNGGATGIALAEIYDATPAGAFGATTPRLTNVSARTHVGTDGDILIAGFSISGATAKTVLIRAVGPALTGFGVAGTLVDPKLELYNGAGAKLDENDNWVLSTASAQASVGAFALTAGSKDAVLIATLTPGSYTAQVSGVGGTTGVALVEIYELP